MKLIVRITILFVLVSLVVFAIGGLISFRIMMREVNIEQQRFLSERLKRVGKMIERRQPQDSLKLNKLIIVPLDEITDDMLAFSDTLVIHSQLDRIEPHLKLDAIRTIAGKSYAITIFDVIVEPDDIKEGLVESLVTMYLILFGAVVLIGWIASYYLLKPFNKTLAIIQSFSLTEPDQKSIFPKSSIQEFKRLNQFLEEMTDKVLRDYQLLKEFSENASHELQTPISIIQGKLDVVMDSDDLSEEMTKQIAAAQSMLKRLSNLSNSLSLLTKIENKEFDNRTKVDLSKKVKDSLEEFKELIELKSISISSQIESNVEVIVDSTLIDLLLTNLMNNAIRHNWENGTIHVTLSSTFLEISNSGADLVEDPSSLFERFKKSNQSTSSMGLGLAIVKKICEHYNYKISYNQQNKQHQLTVTIGSN